MIKWTKVWAYLGNNFQDKNEFKRLREYLIKSKVVDYLKELLLKCRKVCVAKCRARNESLCSRF